ncbi:LLM class flavin-dependent oxidoreductase [Tsukamurella sp. 8F]|uniref:LLM class flavin-dependent oxidoreductase n=1 Tax=unclassified Tsukamurella TaxID=2633480 RepID=UPI0023B9FC21|nr:MULTISPECIES: LLM class flavin-dependent oxidoreductase [unclassified Tsukamurella]MDF0529734.1 LLM class flavin-dependent oxidoreductase [Tsukamurella sp. 8J]MDF0586019.1 LLM class flavin-dependent oxidoreductase [Tsukamurella sp. 8F]
MAEHSSGRYLWYIPNTVESGHRGDDTREGWGTLDFSVDLALTAERHGWDGALLGTGWGRPDTFTVGTALAARTTRFQPLVAIRPGYWQPANFASAAATLDHLSGGRLLINIVSGLDDAASYGDGEFDQARRYDRTREFLQVVRRLWSEDDVRHSGEFYRLDGSTVRPHVYGANEGRHPTLYFGGASPAAERVAAEEADVQLFWGEPLDGVAERIDRLRALSDSVGRRHAPLEFGLRVTTLVRDTADEAWRDAEAKLDAYAEAAQRRTGFTKRRAVGQQRLLDLAERGEVLDSCLYTAPGKYGGGGAGTTWLVGSPDDVADALQRYRDLGVTHFVLSDTPYREETARVGDALIGRLRAGAEAVAQ